MSVTAIAGVEQVDFAPYWRDDRPKWLEIDFRPHLHRVQLQGCEIEYVDYGNMQGPAIVFVHGMISNWQVFLDNIEYFAPTHRVIGINLPGSANTAVPPGKPLSMQLFAATVVDLLDHLQIERADLMGNSMGGFTVLATAALYPDRVGKVVAVSPAGVWRKKFPKETLARASQIGYKAGIRQRVSRDSASRFGAIRPGTRKLLLGPLSGITPHGDKLPAELVYEMLGGYGNQALPAVLRALFEDNLFNYFDRIKCPVLVVWGDRDGVIPVSESKVIAERLPHARVLVYKDTGHVAMIERARHFNPMVAEFLAE